MPAEFHFIRPYFLLALIPLSIIVWLLFKRRLAASDWLAVCDAKLLPHILIGSPGKTHHYSIILIALCGLLAVLALAGPTWERIPQPVFRGDGALVIALDLSRSMDATDIHPSRLERARYKITDLLKLRGEGQTALIVYAGDAFTVAPLTDDVKTIISQIPALTTSIMPAQGSNTAAALTRASALLKQAGNSKGHILLVTDGVEDDHAKEAMSKSLRQGYKISILAAGTQEGSPIILANGGFLKDENGAIVIPSAEPERLAAAAALGGGKYTPLQPGDGDVEILNDFFNGRLSEGNEAQAGLHTDIWREQGPWLLLFILPFAALAFRRGYIPLLLIFTLPPQPSSAFEWDELWLNENQQALRHFNAGEAEEASRKFSDPAWKAAAKYRSGEYQTIPELLRDYKSEESFYNSGNALARQGKYREAIEYYDKTLRLNPAHDDAKYNRALVEEALKQQTQQTQQDGSAEEGSAQQSGTDGQQADASEAKQQSADPAPGQQSGDRVQADEEQNAGQQSEYTEAGEDGEQQESLSINRAQQDEELQAKEQLQATEQWLKRIPDDPAGLLRRKFRYQHRQRDDRRDEGAEKGW